MEWLKNLSKVIEYIEDNLDKTVSTEEAVLIVIKKEQENL